MFGVNRNGPCYSHGHFPIIPLKIPWSKIWEPQHGRVISNPYCIRVSYKGTALFMISAKIPWTGPLSLNTFSQ